MRRFLFAVLVVAMLVVPSTVFAQPPDDVAQLGDLGIYVVGGFIPLERVDAHVTRVSTLFGWPWTPATGTYWMPAPQGEQRKLTRKLYDPVTGDAIGSAVERADVFGNFNKVMMTPPRDEAFYPCSFPFKWKCNYLVAPAVMEWHSPVQMNYDPFLTVLGLNYWPYLDISAAADPQDTISPVWIDVFNYNPLFPWGYHENWEINGMLWKLSDVDLD